jgi:hypothetical protein
MRLNCVGVIALILGFGAVCSVAGAQNKLTSKEVSDGWILLFDGETDYGWRSSAGAAWILKDGALEAPAGGETSISTTTRFGDCEIRGEAFIEENSSASVGFWGNNSQTKRLSSKGKGRWSAFTALASSKPNGPGRGPITLTSGGQSAVRFRSLKLRPLGLKTIFNGKDLSGWKVIEGHKSVFSVTPEGWLNIKNGNGEIQTEGKWGDFILQLEVYSNGDHLNSGVFFREEPGQFWLGYEAQIRNQWEGDDRTKAVDYGTGGIYNRQPARKVVSSDREWFTMTISAVGKHMACWVNGIQVSDFEDTRPDNQTNARNGARTAPGVFSLQGHDPTTDLSFRNIRTIELARGEN